MTAARINCGWTAWLDAAQLGERNHAHFNDAIIHNHLVPRGTALYNAGSPLTFIHSVHSGNFRTGVCTEDGVEQIIAFPGQGDFVGLEAIATGVHRCSTVALEDSSVCTASYGEIVKVCQASPRLWQHFYRLLAKEITQGNSLMMMLGTMNAEARVADFLLQFAERLARRGYSATAMRLPMKREELASFLGLRLETVCRILGSWRTEGVLGVSGRNIVLKDAERLRDKRLAPSATPAWSATPAPVHYSPAASSPQALAA